MTRPTKQLMVAVVVTFLDLAILSRYAAVMRRLHKSPQGRHSDHAPDPVMPVSLEEGD
jgi:hypothetical protein